MPGISWYAENIVYYILWSEGHSVMSDSCIVRVCLVHGIRQARVLEWVAFPFARKSSRPRDWTQVSCNAGRFFTIWASAPNPAPDSSSEEFYLTFKKY